MIDAIIWKYGHKEGLSMRGDKILDWPYNFTMPNEAELKALDDEYQKATEYRIKRKALLPSVEEQLDMIYNDKKNNTNTWVELIDRIKAANPKPS